MRLVLSRYACVRAHDGRMVAEGARTTTQVPLEGAGAMAFVAALAAPGTVEDAAERAGLEFADATRLAESLVAAEILVGEADAEAERASVWSFHDRLFHSRTRPADRSEWTIRELPSAFPERTWRPLVPLPRPDLVALERDDPPLAQVQGNRMSIRVHGSRPMTLERLAEFLFRVGRVDDVWQIGDELYAGRPYPSAGALYELELYIAVRDCAGLEPGLYHYAAEHHQLALVPASAEDVQRLLADAAAGMGVPSLPQVLIVVAARFPRIGAKYGPLAYSLVLKNVGVLMQTMYLSASAMGLAGCAVGAGDAQIFARATGLDVDDEASVGEFCLGEPRED